MFFFKREVESWMKMTKRDQEIANVTILVEDVKGVVNISKVNCRFLNTGK